MPKFLSRSAAQALALSFGASALALSAPAAAQTGAAMDAEFATFTPNANPNKHKIDYSIWDEAMKNLVVSMGPSLRQTAGIPETQLGTRRQYGHDSSYRLEGTRLLFSFLDNDIIASFTEYRQDLEATADKVDIQAMSRNEQLAYWINLHNVAMIEQIANAWPVRQPREIMIDGVPLNDAKILTVEGVKLSLRDIRTKIVFANWKSPKVIYGFWHGEIGGPSLQREAFNADNVARLLNSGAAEFVNSLRGTQKRGNRLLVAETFLEAAPYFFPNFDADLRAHIGGYASEEVKKILANTDRTEAVISEYDIADLAGGYREPTYNTITTDGVANSFRIPFSMTRLLTQRQEKLERLIRRGERTGTVIVNNLTPPDQEDGDGQVE